MEIEWSLAGSAVCSSPVSSRVCILDTGSRRPSVLHNPLVRPSASVVKRGTAEGRGRIVRRAGLLVPDSGVVESESDFESREGGYQHLAWKVARWKVTHGGQSGTRVFGLWVMDRRIVPPPPPDRGAPEDLLKHTLKADQSTHPSSKE